MLTATKSFGSRVLVPPDALPRFWLFMYRSTPVTYLLSTMVSTGLAGVPIVCDANELLNINPPAGQTCKNYLTEYMDSVGGTLLNPEALQQCQFCPVTDTDTLLAALNIYFSERWRDFGISMAYVGINVAGALLLYWLFRVPKNPRLQRVK
jgi:ATP-binding cassette, subfamily G (WHITE), member 2, PDR